MLAAACPLYHQGIRSGVGEEMRDQIKSFTARKDLTEQTYDKLYKVLAADLAAGFPKSELIDFMKYLQKECHLEKELLEEAEIERMFKATGLKDNKNQKDVLIEFMDKCLK